MSFRLLKIFTSLALRFQDFQRWAPEGVSLGVDAGHGRRKPASSPPTTSLGCASGHPWPGLNSILAITCRQENASNRRPETRYFISSQPADDPYRLAQAVRAHWAIENNLTVGCWTEDHNRTRQGHGTANLAVMRHIALNLIRNDPLRKVGIKVKRKRAGWDNDYLLRLIRGI